MVIKVLDEDVTASDLVSFPDKDIFAIFQLTLLLGWRNPNKDLLFVRKQWH